MVPVSKIRQGEGGVVLWVGCVHWALICLCLCVSLGIDLFLFVFRCSQAGRW